MRTLLLFRGCPASGKSTFIEKHGLKPYTLSADDIRLLCQSSIQTVDGLEQINQKNDGVVWDILFTILERRMKLGEFTVIDACNSKTSEINRYKKLAEEYRYRMFIVDLTDVSIEECKRRNRLRDPYKIVPDEVIDRMYSRFRTQKIPSGITKIKPEDFEKKVFLRKFDMSKYKTVVVIGDIHGCYTCLKTYFDQYPFSEDNMYIFTGDYLDRGLENAETIKLLLSLYQKSNVLMLEANHEKHIWDYANDRTSVSKEFEFRTKKQLEEAGIDKKDLRMFYRSLGQCAWFKYHDKDVFVSHGGIAKLPEKNLIFMATDQFIHGVGSYNDYEKIAETWNNTKSNTIQIHGHRNTKSSEIQNGFVFNLEGKIEFGGELRVAHIDNELGAARVNCISIKNNVFREPEETEINTENLNSSVADLVLSLRGNKKCINEKVFGNISSFNFTRDVFFHRNRWNDLTTKARGLYINTNTMKIVARSYDKFFNINEVEDTRFNNLEYKFKFPVAAYVKENGYLGLISYNEETDDLFFATKSDCGEGPYKKWLIEAFDKAIGSDKRLQIKDYCKDNNCTLVFENVDMENDPHIIKYDKSTLYLLDIIHNDIKYSKFSYDTVKQFAGLYGLNCKKLAKEFSNWGEFYDWYNEVTKEDEYRFNDRLIEGFVLEDSAGFMTKLKLNYYNFWKFMRSVSHEVINKGYITDTQKLVTPLANYYYGWLKKWCESIPDKNERKKKIPTEIITLRDKFYQEFDINNY